MSRASTFTLISLLSLGGTQASATCTTYYAQKAKEAYAADNIQAHKRHDESWAVAAGTGGVIGTVMGAGIGSAEGAAVSTVPGAVIGGVVGAGGGAAMGSVLTSTDNYDYMFTESDRLRIVAQFFQLNENEDSLSLRTLHRDLEIKYNVRVTFNDLVQSMREVNASCDSGKNLNIVTTDQAIAAIITNLAANGKTQ